MRVNQQLVARVTACAFFLAPAAFADDLYRNGASPRGLGTQADFRAFLGSSSIADTAPPDWDDQWNWHFGAQYRRGATLDLGGKSFKLYFRSSTSGAATRVRDSRLPDSEHDNQSPDLRLHSFGFAYSF